MKKVNVRSLLCHCEESRSYRDDVAISKNVKSRPIPFVLFKTFLIASCAVVFLVLMPVFVFADYVGCSQVKAQACETVPFPAALETLTITHVPKSPLGCQPGAGVLIYCSYNQTTGKYVGCSTDTYPGVSIGDASLIPTFFPSYTLIYYYYDHLWRIMQFIYAEGGECHWSCNDVSFDCSTCVGTSTGTVNTGVPCSSPSPAVSTTVCGGKSIFETADGNWSCSLCTNGETKACPYSGSQSGICKAGTQTCSNGQWGACEGEVLPAAQEICGDNLDNNCDGNTDEGCVTCDNNNCGSDCSSNIPFDSSVNSSSGNLYHDQTLFNTNTLGITLSYNSIDNYSGPLGKGWTHNWNIFLFSNPSDNSIGLKQADGRIVYFKLNNGIYYPEAQSGEDSYITYTSDTYTLIEKNGTTYNFNATTGKLTSIRDRNGNTTTLTYTGANLTSITDPSGRLIYLTYDSQNRISTVRDLNNNTYTFTYTNGILVGLSTQSSTLSPQSWSYTYDSNGQMLTKTDPQGYVTTYTYDTDGKVVSSQDPEGKIKAISYEPSANSVTVTEKDGGIWTYKYDPVLNVTTEKTDPQGNTTTSQYDQYKNLISTTGPDGKITSYTYDEYGNMASVTDTAGNTTSYTYNEYGQVTGITDSQANVTSYEYDSNGNQTAIIDSTGAFTRYQYDAKGNLIQLITPNSQLTTFIYDQFNNLIAVTDSTGSTTTFTYDTSGNMTSQTDPKGNITRFEYNSLNQIVKITDSQGNITTYTYDANGNRTSVTNPNGKTTYYEFNYKGQLIKETDSGGDVTLYGYGNTGCASCGGGSDKLTSITDSKGRVTNYVYDSIGRLIKIIDPINGEITYTYDSRGRLTSVTDSIGNTTSYQYDSLGRVIKTDSPDTGITTYTYNSVGNILTKTDANGITTAYAYDTLNRLLQIQFPDSSENITYTYDNCANGIGKLCTMTDPSGTTAYGYDSLGRTTKETKTILGINYTTNYEYDKTGKITTITYPSGRKVSYTYNSIYRPTSVSQQMNKGTKTLANNFIYDKIGNPLSMTLGNGLTQQWAYDQKNRISAIYVPNILNLNYSYDPIGNITAITDNLEPSKSKAYDYDPVDRLIAATGPWGSLAWTYDANGNRLSQANAEITNYSYQSNKLIFTSTSTSASASASTYSYDNNGNTISDGQKEFVYNQNQRLIKAVENGKVLGEYVYNGKGQRVIKKIGQADTSSSSPQNIVYHYDLAGRLIEETAGNGKLLVDYVYLNSQPFAMIRKQGNNEETFYYHNDHLGTPKVLTDKLQKVVWNVEFDPFGNELQNNGRQGSYIRNVENNIFFSGQYRDKETGLNQNWHRDFDPKIGRYPQGDPIGLKGGMNPYIYVQNQPTVLRDPLGLYGTNDCSYYEQRCKESGGKYYCETVQFWCNSFPKYPDPDPTTDDDFEGWARCTRKCLQDCDQEQYKCEQDHPNPDSSTDNFFDWKPTSCHIKCYTQCGVGQMTDWSIPADQADAFY